MSLGQPKMDAEWQAYDDARTLTNAEEIKQDPNRLNKAKEAAKKQLENEQERLKAMRKVAGGSSGDNRRVKIKQNSTGNFNSFKRII